ncbi:MAG: MFS transporter, partial [Gorillibacterium sp.]|nr:MFS transporter [Gorillibacterium sp.]
NVGLFASFAVFLVLFIWIERFAKDPLVPLHLFRNRMFSTTMGLSVLYGTVIMAASIYFPLFLQGVFGESATSTGRIMIPFMLGIIVSGGLTGRLIGAITFRSIYVLASVILLVATGFLSQMTTDTERWVFTIYMIVYGLGLGITYPTVISSALYKVNQNVQGIVTSLSTFFRSLGMAVGLAVLTSVQSNILDSKIHAILPEEIGKNMKNTTDFLIPQIRKLIPDDLYKQMVNALTQSIASIFLVTLFLIAATIVIALVMGRAKEELALEKTMQPKINS